jgi:hypothetical protein
MDIKMDTSAGAQQDLHFLLQDLMERGVCWCGGGGALTLHI